MEGGFEIRIPVGAREFLPSKTVQTCLGLIQPTAERVPAFFTGDREAEAWNWSPQCSADI